MPNATHESGDEGTYEEPTPPANANHYDDDPAPPAAPPPLPASGEAGSGEGPEPPLPTDAAYWRDAFQRDLQHGIATLGLSAREAYRRACMNLVPDLPDGSRPPCARDAPGAPGAPAPPTFADHDADMTGGRRPPASPSSAKRPRNAPASDPPGEQQHTCPDMNTTAAPGHTPVVPFDTDAGTCTTPGCRRRSLFPHGTCCPRCPGQSARRGGAPATPPAVTMSTLRSPCPRRPNRHHHRRRRHRPRPQRTHGRNRHRHRSLPSHARQRPARHNCHRSGPARRDAARPHAMPSSPSP